MIFRFGGDQSVFDPHGPIARSIATHGWWLLLMSIAVYLVVMVALLIALGRRRREIDDQPETTRRLTRNVSIAVALTVVILVGIAASSVVSGRGIVDNIVGYSVYGDYRTNSPPSAIIAAVARGEVDVAAAWGPMAGYFAARQPVALDVVPVQPQVDGRFLPQTFSIAMATRRRDTARHDRLEHFIDRRRGEIDRILADYHVPRVDE